MPSISVRDVAAAAGVSVGTVSNVLNRPHKVPEETVRRVTAAIESLGFVRNDAARQLRAGRSRTLGLIVLDAANPFFSDVARGAETAADEGGSAVLLGNSAEDPEREAHYLDLFEEQRARAVLISPVGDVFARLERLQSRGIPAVLVDRQADRPGFASVSVDDVAGGRIAARHLLAGGRRRFAFVGGPRELRQVADRLEGFRTEVERAGGHVDHVPTAQLTVQEGGDAARRLLAQAPADRPDAVFAANDLVALGILQAFLLDGAVRVPEDIALLGYDDIAFAEAAAIPLSSIRQPRELIGRTAVELAEQQLAGEGTPRHVVFQPELVARRSTAF